MKMKIFGDPKREFLTSKARLNFEVYGQQQGKITPKAEKKIGPFFQGGFSSAFFDIRTCSFLLIQGSSLLLHRYCTFHSAQFLSHFMQFYKFSKH